MTARIKAVALALVTLLLAVLLLAPGALAAPAPAEPAPAEPTPLPEAEGPIPPERDPTIPPIRAERTPPPLPPMDEVPPAPEGLVPPPPQAWVSDNVGVLSDPTRHALNRRLAAYEAQTGHQVIVWIDDTTRGLPIETFAVEAFEHWRIGRGNLDDGLGIFIMVEDRAMRVEVGYGLEPVVTDLEASQVIRSTMVPAIERGEWDLAVIRGVEALVDIIEGQPNALPSDPMDRAGPPHPVDPRAETAKIVGIVVAIILFIILLIKYPRIALLLLFFVGRGRGGGGGGPGFGGGGGRSGGGGASGRW